MTPTKVRSAAYRARKKVRDSDALVRLERYERVLASIREWLKSAPLESGYCCCGSRIEDHSFGSGHSPVDDLAYSASGQIEMIDDALADKP